MKALILNSGMGSRMGSLTSEHPKCMTELKDEETILSRQLRLLTEAGIDRVVITTGRFAEVLTQYCRELKLPCDFTFVHNDIYAETNYIYSIALAAKELQDDDILLLHGDLVFDREALSRVLKEQHSCMAVSSTQPIPEKDFKAVIKKGRIEKVGVEFFEDVMAAQPLYKLKQADWLIWLENVLRFCEAGERRCYAENALNEVTERLPLYPCDVEELLCTEVDNPEDLRKVRELL